MLSLDKQNRYRERYRAMRPGWRTSGEVYELRIRPYATGDAVVLDLGCGAGGVMELLGAQVKMLAGVDRHWPSLLCNRARAMRRVFGDVNALPFRVASFDLVVCSWVIEHIARPDRLFAEVSRVLKPAGHFVFLTPNAANPVTWLNRLTPKLAQAPLVRILYGRAQADTFPVTYRANTLRALRKLAGEVGLCVCTLETIHDPTYLAFGEVAFCLSALVERFIADECAVHIVGDFAKT